MSKEYLEALKELCEFVNYCDEANEDVGVIEEALQRLESIDNSNPSEALEDLENMVDTFLVENKNKIEFNKVNNYDCELLEERRKDLESYKQALLKAQEQAKVLEIIKKKNVNITSLKAYDLEEYNMVYENKLTQEEFDLLKEILK